MYIFGVSFLKLTLCSAGHNTRCALPHESWQRQLGQSQHSLRLAVLTRAPRRAGAGRWGARSPGRSGPAGARALRRCAPRPRWGARRWCTAAAWRRRATACGLACAAAGGPRRRSHWRPGCLRELARRPSRAAPHRRRRGVTSRPLPHARAILAVRTQRARPASAPSVQHLPLFTWVHTRTDCSSSLSPLNPTDVKLRSKIARHAKICWWSKRTQKSAENEATAV